ncbi:MAG: phosphate ABC transporter permease PstA [Chthonomonadales bacterium]|nr:phosphate ABC transporter permease PstA [Chthonomonadales bacterium]
MGRAQLGSPRTISANVRKQRIAFGCLYAVLAMVVLPIAWLFAYIIYHGYRQISWDFLRLPPTAVDAAGGIFPAIVGTFYLMLGTIAVALPLGVGGAVYLTEYAGRSRLVRLIRLAIVNLAGVPSIVHGLFGLGFFVLFVGGGIDRFILHTQRPVWGQPCLLWGFCTLAVVILPIIITATEEALLSVPRSFREASLGLGATKWQTVRRVVLPTALPGILTGAILGIGRAAGETAPVMITCAASFKPFLPSGLNDSAMLLPYHLYFVVTQVPNPSLQLQAGIALVLVALVFFINVSAVVLRTREHRRRKW